MDMDKISMLCGTWFFSILVFLCWFFCDHRESHFSELRHRFQCLPRRDQLDKDFFRQDQYRQLYHYRRVFTVLKKIPLFHGFWALWIQVLKIAEHPTHPPKSPKIFEWYFSNFSELETILNRRNTVNGAPGHHTLNASGEDLCCDKDKTQNSLLGRISAGITQTVNDVIQVNTRQIRTFFWGNFWSKGSFINTEKSKLQLTHFCCILIAKLIGRCRLYPP